MQAHEMTGEQTPAKPADRIFPSAAHHTTQIRTTTQGGSAGPASSQGQSSRRRKQAVIAPLFILLILWLYLFYAEGAITQGPSGKAFSADWAMFVAGAQVLKHGGNPYDHTQLYISEKKLLELQDLPITSKRPVVRVGNPPLFLWALEGLSGLPFQFVALLWMFGLYVLSGIGFLATLKFLGWRRTFVPTAVFLMMPQVAVGVFYGNPIGLVFAFMCLGLVLAQRKPLIGGALLTAAWLKPPVALPIVLLIMLFHSPKARSVIVGFSLTTAGLFAGTLGATGWNSIGLWFHGLLDYSRDMSIQPDVASLAGLYVRWAPSGLRLTLEGLAMAVACLVTLRCWLKFRGHTPVPPLQVAWLWFVWMLATPYAHFFDEILLTLPIMAILGQDGSQLGRRWAVISLYAMFFSLLFISITPFNVYLLPVMLIVAGACLLIAARDTAHGDQRSDKRELLRVGTCARPSH